MPAKPANDVRHRIVLDGEAVDYRLQRSSRRTIALRVDQDGLRVGAPLRARLEDIESLVRQHGRWVLDKLATWRERPPPATLQASEGSALTLLGQAWTLRLHRGQRPASLRCKNTACAAVWLHRLACLPGGCARLPRRRRGQFKAPPPLPSYSPPDPSPSGLLPAAGAPD